MSERRPDTGPAPAWLRDLARLAGRLGVDLIGRDDPRYEQARLLYNRFHDMRPAALVRARAASSVAEVLRFAVDHGAALAIRGGGHHIGGFGSCEGGIVIDFSAFREVTVDRAGAVVEAEPGARLSDVDRRLAPLGLVIPVGTVSDTGIAGLTLGGGIGWLIGRYGLTCDQLVAADVVLADGRQVLADDNEHSDLLWALRGGGGNFGVVTRLRYRPSALPQCSVGSGAVRLRDAADALAGVLEFLESGCPRELTVAPTLFRTPTGEPMLSIDFCLTGGDARILKSLAAAAGPANWSVEHGADYLKWQSAFDGLFMPPMRGYWKSRYSERLSAGDVERMIDAFDAAPVERAAVLVEHLHGAFLDTGYERSAFPLRWARFGVLLSARWPDKAQDEVAIGWVKKSFLKLDPANTSAAYLNYTANDDPRAVGSFAGSTAGRLAEVKGRYDPRNVFRRNHNLRPSHAGGSAEKTRDSRHALRAP